MSVSFLEILSCMRKGAVDQYLIEYKREQQLKKRKHRIIFIIIMIVILIGVGILIYNIGLT